MKKLFFFAAAATLVATSCSDDFAPGKNQAGIPEGKSVIYATQLNDLDPQSRTYAEEQPNGSFLPRWQKGDAIGLFGTTGSYITNDSFVYAESTDAEGEEVTKFVGQSNLLAGSSFFGYYPFNPAGLNNDNTISMYIPSTQMFNYAMSGQSAEGITAEPGSYAQNVRPAIAVGTADEDNVLNMKFSPIATALRVPVTGFGTVKYATLTITETTASEGSPAEYDLAGSYTINPQSVLVEGNVTSTITGLTYDNFVENSGNNTVTLNFGEGIELDPEIPIWLWFVVANGVPLDGSTAALTLYQNDDVKQKVSRNITTKTPGAKTSGGIQNLWSTNDGNTYWDFTFGQYPVTNALDLLEYIYVATTGFETTGNLISNWNLLNPTTYKNVYEYTNLQNMIESGVEFETDEATGQITATCSDASLVVLKPALIMNPIAITPTAIANALNWTSNANQWTALPTYYEKAYGNVINNNAIPSIGGGNITYSISGLNSDVTIGGAEGAPLKVEDAFFTGTNSTYTGTLSNITLDYVEVDGDAFFGNLKKNGASTIYQNVIIGEHCTVADIPEGENGYLFNSINGSLLNGAAPTFYAQSIKENNSELLIAGTLNINAATFSFPEAGVTPLDFGQIAITYTTTAPVIYVTDKEMAEEVIGMVSEDNTNPYSVIDTPETDGAIATSYWTGFAPNNAQAGTAESLAYTVQVTAATEYAPFTMVYNLDLMNNPWWNANNTQTVGLNCTANNFEISNVNINGTNDKEQLSAGAMTNYSLLGGTSIVTGNLTINKITITSTSEYAPFVSLAAVSTSAGEGTNATISVTDMTVNGTKSGQSNTCGGLYGVLTETTVAYVNTQSSTDFTEDPSLYWGNIAGRMSFSVSPSTTMKVTNPFTDDENAFGLVTVTYTSDKVNTSQADAPIIEISGFGDLEVPPTKNSSTIGKIQLVNGGSDNSGDMVIVQYGQDYYLFVSNGTDYQAQYEVTPLKKARK